MSERPTPETDAVWADKSKNILEHARSLECQRDELLDRLTDLELRMPEELARLERERDAERALADRLAGQLEPLAWLAGYERPNAAELAMLGWKEARSE